jgi:hypothetical protein
VKVSPNIFTRELSIRYGVPVSSDALTRRIVSGRIPATLNEKGTRWKLDLADIEVAAEVLGLVKIPA